jgi:hypothetical protein
MVMGLCCKYIDELFRCRFMALNLPFTINLQTRLGVIPAHKFQAEFIKIDRAYRLTVRLVIRLPIDRPIAHF